MNLICQFFFFIKRIFNIFRVYISKVMLIRNNEALEVGRAQNPNSGTAGPI